MTDPAIAFLPNSGYGPYERGHMLDVFLKEKNGSESLGVVWPGLNVPQSFDSVLTCHQVSLCSPIGSILRFRSRCFKKA